jgi:hypothetical protein
MPHTGSLALPGGKVVALDAGIAADFNGSSLEQQPPACGLSA